jgi:bla regulator protein blaR1
MIIQFINHLWQSSCFALLAGLLAFVLRKNSPKVRYWVWLSASLKFLIPFALLVSLGTVVPRPARRPVSVAVPVFPNALVQIAKPFSPALKATVPAHAPLDWAPVAIGVVWALGLLAITLARCRSWLGVRAALRASTPIELPIPVRALITPGAEEPGIVGFLRPVLVLPAQLLEHLNPRQLGAILTHELCHVRRRDNLFAAVHMVVEAIFWFHPLVWWIGSRMVEERELACDEEVLRMGYEPVDYVEGILKVCRFYLESPLPCISGVTGADVKKRLRAILSGSIANELNGAKRLALTAIGLAALAIPVLIGVLNAPAIRAQSAPAVAPKFEVASVKVPPVASGQPYDINLGTIQNETVTLTNVSLADCTRFAYGLTSDSQLLGPDWIKSKELRYDIVAKTAPGTTRAKALQMMQALLAERFRLALHREQRVLAYYALVVAKGGPRMPGANDAPARVPTGVQGQLRIISNRMPISTVATLLSRYMRAFVVDETGLAGDFAVKLGWTPDDRPIPDDERGPSVFTAVEEQLGLRLVSKKGPMDVLVVDSAEKTPTEN